MVNANTMKLLLPRQSGAGGADGRSLPAGADHRPPIMTKLYPQESSKPDFTGIVQLLPYPPATHPRPVVKHRPTGSNRQYSDTPGTAVAGNSPRPELGPKLRKDKT